MDWGQAALWFGIVMVLAAVYLTVGAIVADFVDWTLRTKGGKPEGLDTPTWWAGVFIWPLFVAQGMRGLWLGWRIGWREGMRLRKEAKHEE